jgi:DNA-binding NarL/FixJ family response regulator
MKNKIRILIVDDHGMMRFALAQGIECHSDLLLVGETDNGAEALKLYRKQKPDVVTMDFKLPGMDGVESTALIRREFPDARVLLLSIYEGVEDIWRAMQAGAAGYVSKSAEIDEVILAIRAIAGGEKYFSGGLDKKLETRQATQALSPQELNVLREIIAGRSPKEITDVLNLKEQTVRTYIKNIHAKLGVTDRAQLITTVIKRGIIHLDT